jgi:hypothetical protein
MKMFNIIKIVIVIFSFSENHLKTFYQFQRLTGITRNEVMIMYVEPKGLLRRWTSAASL